MEKYFKIHKIIKATIYGVPHIVLNASHVLTHLIPNIPMSEIIS